MLLAEVGLPPGAEVDRASLDKARDMSGWELSSYEVQPDRVVFYVWPRAGGTTFSFAFRPRFSMKALTGPSLLYDYYNPDASASVPPVKLEVRARS